LNLKELKEAQPKRNLFRHPKIYSWQVALQQSLLPLRSSF